MGNLGIMQIDATRVQQQKKQQPAQVKTKSESVSFWDEAWTGNQIAKLTGDNFFTDWLQNKDKVCTDGKDDGKIGFWEVTKSVAKGLICGIPKMMINHPLATAITIGVGAGLTALTGGAILPVLGAAGVAMGVGMVGYGGYKAATAKTDREVKQALETLGTGVATTALSIASAGQTLEKAAEAGVKTAQVSKDANIIQKTLQMFKSIPESLKMSKNWTMSYIAGKPVNIELTDGTKQVKVKGKLVEETFENGGYRKYDAQGNVAEELKINNGNESFYKNGTIKEEILADGTIRKYGRDYTKTTFPDGSYKIVDNETGTVIEEFKFSPDRKSWTKYYQGKIKDQKLPDGTRITHTNLYDDMTCTRTVYPDGTYKVVDDMTGKIIEGKLIDGTEIQHSRSWVYKNHSGVVEQRGNYTKTLLPDGSYKTVDNKTNIIVEIKQTDGTVISHNKYYNGVKGDFTRTTLKDGSYKVINNQNGELVDLKSAEQVAAEIVRSENYSSNYSSTQWSDVPTSSSLPKSESYKTSYNDDSTFLLLTWGR